MNALQFSISAILTTLRHQRLQRLIVHVLMHRMMYNSFHMACNMTNIVQSMLLVSEHYSTATSSFCDITDRVSCSKVLNSSYSSLMGVPLAVLGCCFCLIALLLALPVYFSQPSSMTGIQYIIICVVIILVYVCKTKQ